MTPSPHPDGVSVSGDEGREGGSDSATARAIVSPKSDNQAEPKWETVEDAVRRLGRVGAWAPGAYVSKCLTCGIQFIGDKRALSCLPCAVSALVGNGSPLAPTMALTDATSLNKPSIPQGESTAADPIDMVLFCPKCAHQHLDAPDQTGHVPQGQAWTNPPHRSHLCRACGHIWRPADVPTNGVAAIKTRGKNDSPLPPPPAAGQDLSEAVLDGSTSQRDTLGRLVREAWVRWALTRPNPKASWLAPYDDLAEADKEADRQIGEAVWARAELILAFPPPPPLPDLEGVKEALRPFAMLADRTVCPDDHPHYVVGLTGDYSIWAGELRAARAALQALEAKNV